MSQHLISRLLATSLTSASSRFCLKARDAASAATCQAVTRHDVAKRIGRPAKRSPKSTSPQLQSKRSKFYKSISSIYQTYVSTSCICMRDSLGLCQFNGMLLTCLSKTMGLRCSTAGEPLGYMASMSTSPGIAWKCNQPSAGPDAWCPLSFEPPLSDPPQAFPRILQRNHKINEHRTAAELQNEACPRINRTNRQS